MKEYSPELDALIRLGKTLFIKAYRWLDKPHILRIRKKTIVIGVLAMFLVYHLLAAKPQQIVYAGAVGPKAAPISPLVVKVPPKKAALPQTHLQAAQSVEAIPEAPVSTPAPIVQSSTNNSGGAVPNCGDNTYSNYIYMHESGCSTTITNSIGCLGIGQACPGSKLYAACPNLDYACENSFFSSYATAVYGGWAGAYAFWLVHHWW